MEHAPTRRIADQLILAPPACPGTGFASWLFSKGNSCASQLKCSGANTESHSPEILCAVGQLLLVY